MTEINRLLAIMAQLRDKEKGCPWDVEQTFASIAPCTIEEAYEVVDAIERNDMKDLKEELGDLLLQVVFHAQMAQEAGLFNFADVAKAISDKLERRHPHVFNNPPLPLGEGDGKTTFGRRFSIRGEGPAFTSDAQVESWENIKAEERREKNDGVPQSLLDAIPVTLPSLVRAYKLQKKAAKAGFDWPEIEPVFNKLSEEIGELRKAINIGVPEDILSEMGDILFVAVNLAKHLKIDPDTALRATIRKFEYRFRAMEAMLAERRSEFKEMSLQQLDELWDQAKATEKMNG